MAGVGLGWAPESRASDSGPWIEDLQDRSRDAAQDPATTTGWRGGEQRLAMGGVGERAWRSGS
jgi:hypothetical protein